jgi:hypothetical protein
MNHMPPQMMDTVDVLRVKLAALRQKHRDLDAKIDGLQEAGSVDQLLIRRLKKEKLALKDQIASLEDRTTPDIIA